MQAPSESNLSHRQCQILYRIPEPPLAVSTIPLECSWLNIITPVLQTLGCSAASPPSNSAGSFLGWYGRTCLPPQPSCLPNTNGKLVSPEGAQEGKNTCPLAVIRPQPLITASPEEAQVVRTGYWPQTAEVHINRMISVSPDSCIFPYIEKHLIP